MKIQIMNILLKKQQKFFWFRIEDDKIQYIIEFFLTYLSIRRDALHPINFIVYHNN